MPTVSWPIGATWRAPRPCFLREPSGVEVAVSDPSEDASCPSVSPDGGRIAYLARVPESGTELRVVARSGGQPVTLATEVESSEYPSWSPDGRFITFAAGFSHQGLGGAGLGR